MISSVIDKILHTLEYASQLYYRLILVVGTADSGKTNVLHCAAERFSSSIINVNIELSRSMLNLTLKQRTIKLSQLLQDIINTPSGNIVIVDNLELIFDISLKQDPLRVLQTISRNKTIIAGWNGTIKDDMLFYAMPGYPEYRKYQIHDFIAIDILNQEKEV